MGKLSKTIGAPIGPVVDPKEIPVGVDEEIRSSTPPPTPDQEPEKSAEDQFDEYEPGKTPPYEKSDEEASDDEVEPESGDEEEEGEVMEEDPKVPGPAPPTSFELPKSGPITPNDIVKSHITLNLLDGAKRLRKALDGAKQTPKKIRDEEPKEKIQTTPRKSKNREPKATEKEFQIDPQFLFRFQQEMIKKIQMDSSLADTDTRSLILSLHSQVATLTGAVELMDESFKKIHSKVLLVHGAAINQEEATTRGFAKLEQLMLDSWKSQGKNRSSIDTNNGLLKEAIKHLEAKQAAEVGATAQAGPSKIQGNWMFPNGATANGQIPPIHPNFTVMPTTGATGSSGFAGYGYREPQPYQAQAECAFCKGAHPSEKCRTFGKWHLRRQVVIGQNGCMYCLRPGACPDGKLHEECAGKPLCDLCHTMYPHPMDQHRRHHHVSLCERCKPMEPPKESIQPPPKKAKPTIKKETSRSSSKKHQ
ncbi:hypothetical protein CAEBREN_02312 [Caenorhabditis brenneri]|uniref:Uncharacterized protein n=1 Tax=Caenorhabditis brenneri TaxID=135651 RepID=G0NDX8_CAEBE|nr:hypothetical protein CAEBREN_02312 [Caenorhabditis brenneri]